jgi:hypothetical protein
MKKIFTSIPFGGITIGIAVLLLGVISILSFVRPNFPQSNSLQANPVKTNTTLTPTSGTANPYPAPTEIATQESTPISIETPTSEERIVLPKLAPYPDLGPFKNMMLIYSRSDKLGFWINSLDGKDEKRLQGWWDEPEIKSQLGEYDFTPSPTANLLLFSSRSFFSESGKSIPDSFWVNNPDGSKPNFILKGNADWIPISPIWSPDGQQIAYQRLYVKNIPNLTGVQIWTINVDGSNDHLIFSDPNMQFGLMGGKLPYIKWFPNGYIYLVPFHHNSTLYALNPTNGQIFPLIGNIDPYAMLSTISPDGQHINKNSDIPLESILKAGLIPTEIPEGAKWDARGNKLVYFQPSTTDAGKTDVFIEDVLMAQKKSVSQFDKEIRFFEISPDGNYLAMSTSEDELYVMDLSTFQLKLLLKAEATRNKDNFINMIWVPNP